MKKRKQHYVWKYYLSPWAENGKLFCLRNGRIFESALDGVANERDFYSGQELNPDDIRLISDFINSMQIPQLRPILNDWITIFQAPYALYQAQRTNEQQAVASGGRDNPDELIHNFEENLHDRIEAIGKRYLNSLRRGNTAFFNKEVDKLRFTYFLCFQFFRTKRQQESILQVDPRMRNSSTRNIWPVLRTIFSTTMCLQILQSEPRFRVIAVENRTSVPFLTGDQPLFNLKADFSGEQPPTELELYYPVTPRKAIVLTQAELDPSVQVSEAGAQIYNNYVYKASYEQIYSSSRAQLESILRSV